MFLLRNTQKKYFELRVNQITVTSICMQCNRAEVEIWKHTDIERSRQLSITNRHVASEKPSPTSRQWKGGVIFTKQLPDKIFPFVLPVLKYYFHIYKYFQTWRIKKEDMSKAKTQLSNSDAKLKVCST